GRSSGGLFRPQLRIELIELPHLAVSAPTEIAVPGIPQIGMRDLFEATCRVAARGEFYGERFVVNKAVSARRADSLVVETLGIELASFDASDLGAHQRRAIFEVVGAVLRPYFELFVVSGQRVHVLLAVVERCGITQCRA